MIKYTLLKLIFLISCFLGSSYFLAAQLEHQAGLQTKTVFQNPIIHVSEELFVEIENWLAQESEDLPLDHFLISRGIAREEVQLFKDQHLSALAENLSATNYKNSFKQGGCVCNAIMPSGSFAKYNNPELLKDFLSPKEYAGWFDQKWR